MVAFYRLPQSVRETVERNARNYADFDRSDPFAYARAISHFRAGVGMYEAEVNTRAVKNSDGDPIMDADNNPLTTRVFTNVKRP